MYTVVFVEDEYLTREEIAQTTDWAGLGLELIGVSDNGIAGEKLIQEVNPDLVITDIRLPGQDGLTMLSHCSVEYSVIISGHTDYEYMKKAIKIGVSDYIQKPVDDEELSATLRSIVAKLDEEKHEYEALHDSMDSDMSIVLPQNVGNFQIQSTISFIQENFNKAIGLHEAADAVNLSESHLSRLFKEVTGLNFLQYLNAYRMNRALVMMRNPRFNVSDISLNCGFPNPGYFSKIFKRFTGQTPSSFRSTIVEE